MTPTLRDAEEMLVARCTSDAAALRLCLETLPERPFRSELADDLHAALTRWCRWCGSAVTAMGGHHLGGDFDPWSVIVSDAEVAQALVNAGPQATDSERERLRIRWCIAFGKHVGSYRVEARSTVRPAPTPLLCSAPVLPLRPRAAFKKTLGAASTASRDPIAHRLIKAGRG